MPDHYAVHLTTDNTTATDDQLDQLVALLGPYHPSLSMGEGRLTAQLTVPASGLPGAVDLAIAVLDSALSAAAVDDVEIVAARVMTDDEFEVWLGGLIGSTDAGKALGLSRQRVLQLERDDPTFPRARRVGRAKAFAAVEIARYAQRDRPTGRPAATG